MQPQLLGGRLPSLTATLSPHASNLSTSPVMCMTQTQAPQPACMSLRIPIWERTVPQPLHGCPLRAPLQTPSAPVFLSATSHGTNFLPGVVLQEIVPHVLANDLMAIRPRSARGSPGPKPSREKPRAPISIANCAQAQTKRTSAILFASAQLWPDSQLRKFRQLVSSLRMGAPSSKSQNQWTGVEQRVL